MTNNKKPGPGGKKAVSKAKRGMATIVSPKLRTLVNSTKQQRPAKPKPGQTWFEV